MSKQELASIAGVGPSAVTKWASGGAIRLQTVHRIAQHFGIDPFTIVEAAVSAATPQVKQGEIDWKERALIAEKRLEKLRSAIKNFNKIVEHLESAL